MIWDAQHIHHQLMLSSDQVVSVSSHHTQQVSQHQARRCACIGLLHIYVLSHLFSAKRSAHESTEESSGH